MSVRRSKSVTACGKGKPLAGLAQFHTCLLAKREGARCVREPPATTSRCDGVHGSGTGRRKHRAEAKPAPLHQEEITENIPSDGERDWERALFLFLSPMDDPENEERRITTRIIERLLLFSRLPKLPITCPGVSRSNPTFRIHVPQTLNPNMAAKGNCFCFRPTRPAGDPSAGGRRNFIHIIYTYQGEQDGTFLLGSLCAKNSPPRCEAPPPHPIQPLGPFA